MQDGPARYLTGPELDAVYTAIDALREEEEFRAIGDAIMENAHLFKVQKMNRHTRGRTPFFTLGGFVLNERLTRRVIECPDSQSAVAELAGTLVHEYLHTQQLGADRGPMVQSINQVAFGFLYAVSLPFELSGVGLRDQNGQGHGILEIDPWLQGIDAEQRVYQALEMRVVESRDAKIALRKGIAETGRVG